MCNTWPDTMLMSNLLKYTPLSVLHVIDANIHWWISFICCENVWNYLIMGLKYLKLCRMPCRSLDPNQLSAIIRISPGADLSLPVQKALAFTTLLARHLILLKCKHVSPLPLKCGSKKGSLALNWKKKIDNHSQVLWQSFDKLWHPFLANLLAELFSLIVICLRELGMIGVIILWDVNLWFVVSFWKINK